MDLKEEFEMVSKRLDELKGSKEQYGIREAIAIASLVTSLERKKEDLYLKAGKYVFECKLDMGEESRRIMENISVIYDRDTYDNAYSAMVDRLNEAMHKAYCLSERVKVYRDNLEMAIARLQELKSNITNINYKYRELGYIYLG